MRVRQHRGSLADSLLTVKQVPATKEALADHINNTLDFPVKFGPGSIRVLDQGYDDRIGWNNYLIIINGMGPYGYCDEIPQ